MLNLLSLQLGSFILHCGIGLSLVDQLLVFGRFFRWINHARAERRRFGFPIARQIFLAHGGNIWVESQVGQGSCFVVKIPLTKAEDSTPVSNPKNR